MKSLLARARARLNHDTSDDGDAPARPYRPWWVASVGIPVTAVLIAATAIAIAVTSDGHDELASAGTTEASTTSAPSTPEGSTAPAAPEAPAPDPAASQKPVAGTAAADLADFFAAVDRVDQRLEAAAEQFNETVGPDTVRVEESLREAVESFHVGEAADAIPAGLPPDLLLKVLIVQDDLTTRASALRGAVHEVNDGRMEDALSCLKNGAVKAERFDADVTAARDLAASSAPIVVAAPDSRTAGELALRISLIYGLNGGCGACGNEASPVELATITWYDQPVTHPEGGSPRHGTIDLGDGGGPLQFFAEYTPGTGWKAHPIAC